MTRRVVRLGLVLVLAVLLSPVPSGAQSACDSRGRMDPRSARLRVSNLIVTREGVAGKITNTTSETALGAAVWVNFYQTRRGGPLGQQCIPIGELAGGEERAFVAPVQVDTTQVEAWDYAVDAGGWR